VPTVRVDVRKAATPLVLSMPVPSVVVPSRKVTVPVGVPKLLDVMVAVNVTGAPLDAEVVELTNAAVVAVAATGIMVSVSANEVLDVNLESPL
jgi:hypothetical protein